MYQAGNQISLISNYPEVKKLAEMLDCQNLIYNVATLTSHFFNRLNHFQNLTFELFYQSLNTYSSGKMAWFIDFCLEQRFLCLYLCTINF